MSTIWGARALRPGDRGADVAELQTRLAGFLGTVPSGVFGEATARQVRAFQRGYMGRERPDGIADRATLAATDAFGAAHPIDFARLACPCGRCGGFGRGLLRGVYHPGEPRVERFHRYEYPGIHRMLLWAVRAAMFYLPDRRLVVSSGYRCGVDNAAHGRATTNHHGKAVDLALVLASGTAAAARGAACDAIRARLVATACAQIGWDRVNRKALEPAAIAPTWVHYDVRCYQRRYLRDPWFCRDARGLDAPLAPFD